jgi:hypothetical protein
MIIIELERRAMLELVREYDVAKRFRKLKKSAPKSIVAVPFWGKGALTLLGIGGGQKSQISRRQQQRRKNLLQHVSLLRKSPNPRREPHTIVRLCQSI